MKAGEPNHKDQTLKFSCKGGFSGSGSSGRVYGNTGRRKLTQVAGLVQEHSMPKTQHK